MEQLKIISLSREKVFDSIYDGVMVCDKNCFIVDFNTAAKNIFCELSKEAIGVSIEEILNEYAEFTEPMRAWQEKVRRFLNEGQKLIPNYSYEFEIMNNSLLCHYHVRLSILHENGDMAGVIALINDTTKQYEILKKLEYMASTDGLTGLMNRRYFIECAEKQLEKAMSSNKSMALVLMDIDYFKKINDNFGHQAGDYILKEISNMTCKNLRATDFMGRYGGEEFVIFLPDTEIEEAALIANRIRKQFENQFFEWCGRVISLSISFGITAYNYGAETNFCDYNELMRKADEALYQAKANGRNCLEMKM